MTDKIINKVLCVWVNILLTNFLDLNNKFKQKYVDS